MGKLKVFLADDHAVLREGLKLLINAQPDLEVVGEAADGESLLGKLAGQPVDLVVMDISMPGLDGISATRRLRELYPKTFVVVLSVHEDAAYLRQILAAGATGYVPKREAAETLILAIKTVAGGRMFIDPVTAARVVTGYLSETPDLDGGPVESLSEREGQVLRWVATGYSNREIAERLDLSVKTVETYKARSMEKLGLGSRVDIVRYAAKRGWLEPS